jgi:hypothetical protein
MHKDVNADLSENSVTGKQATDEPQQPKTDERQSISELLKDIYDR